jgi:DNA repair photolyase
MQRKKKTKSKKRELDSICQACGLCNGTKCFALQKRAAEKFDLPDQLPQNYHGVRFTADAMDCALPISLDSHSGCSYSCLYCFANNLMRAPDRNKAALQKSIMQGSFYSEWPIAKLEKFLARDMKSKQALAMYDLMNAGMPVQLGALGDPFDDLELHSGWAKEAIPLFIKYKQPVRISTKGGTVLQRPEYLKLFEDSPEQFWIAFSTISASDELIAKVDINAPVTSERVAAAKALTDLGCHASLRFRPFLPGISDSYPGEPEAYRVLIEMFAEAGAQAVSFEFIFLEAAPTARQKAMSQIMYRAMGNPKFGEQWNAMSNAAESCRRGSRIYKKAMTYAAREVAHANGMTFGVSDPHFKELNDTGCCCGIPPDDPWFGGWSRRQMTNVVVEAKRAYKTGKPRLWSYLDWAPEWAHKTPIGQMVALNSWHNHRVKKYQTFGDHMRSKWNDPTHPRGPYKYFGGVLFPVGVDNATGDVCYEYRPWHDRWDREFKGIQK